MSSETPMAGDFFSLLAAQKLAPWRAEASSSAPVQTQATTVFAFHFAEGVLMAGDRRATAGNIIVTDRVEKIIEIDSTSLLAVAGVPAKVVGEAGCPEPSRAMDQMLYGIMLDG